MKLSLQEVMSEAVTAYPQSPRTEWVLSWPGQVVLASSIIYWTMEVTQVRRHMILDDSYIYRLFHAVYTLMWMRHFDCTLNRRNALLTVLISDNFFIVTKVKFSLPNFVLACIFQSLRALSKLLNVNFESQ